MTIWQKLLFTVLVAALGLAHAQCVDVSGTWNFVSMWPTGQRLPGPFTFPTTMTLAQSGCSISGSFYTGALSGNVTPSSITFTRLETSGSCDTGLQTEHQVFTGNISPDAATMSGTYLHPTCGEGTWTASRTTPPRPQWHLTLTIDNPGPIPSNLNPRIPQNSVINADVSVADGMGNPAAGINVHFSSSFSVSGFSGHTHSNFAVAPPGQFQDPNSPGTPADVCTTDGAGHCKLLYQVAEFSGTYTVAARSDATQNIPILMDGANITVGLIQTLPVLSQLPPSSSYRLTGAPPATPTTTYAGCPGAQIQHSGTHTATPFLIWALVGLANNYLSRTQYTLGFNDMSLPEGGRFDICSDWSLGTVPTRGNSTGHFSHRKGTSVDIDTTTRSATGQISDTKRPLLKSLAEGVYGLRQYPEETLHYESQQ